MFQGETADFKQYYRVLNDSICAVTAAAIISSRIFTAKIVITKAAVSPIVSHIIVTAVIFAFSGIPFFSV